MVKEIPEEIMANHDDSQCGCGCSGGAGAGSGAVPEILANLVK